MTIAGQSANLIFHDVTKNKHRSSLQKTHGGLRRRRVIIKQHEKMPKRLHIGVCALSIPNTQTHLETRRLVGELNQIS